MSDVPIIDIDAPAAGYMLWKFFEYLGITKSNNLDIKILSVI